MSLVLRTERLVLRRWHESDLEQFAELNADAEVMQYFPSTLGRAESDEMAQRIIGQFAERGFGLWAVEFEGRFAGYTGLYCSSLPMPLSDHVEIGWRLARWAWGRGIATEAARAALTDGADRCGVHRVYAYTTRTNSRSEAVMVKLGMTRRPDLDFDHPRTVGWWGAPHIVYSWDSPGPEAPAVSGRAGAVES